MYDGDHVYIYQDLLGNVNAEETLMCTSVTMMQLKLV